MSDAQQHPSVLALSGGIGGAKLALGMSRVLPDGDLMVVANTGDDFTHLGLDISPDTDTLVYTLSGLADTERGWGRQGETWAFMKALEELGGETWFNLGDGDLAMHVERTRRLAAGETLTTIVGDVCRRLGVATRIVPMSDDPVRTRVLSEGKWLDFQDYFVRLRCEPKVDDIRYDGAASARANSRILAALADPSLRAVVICPSNPMLSIEPILAIPDLRTAIQNCRAAVVAVSPIMAGQAVKGPTAKMMAELGLEASAAEVARRYDGLLDAYVIDERDADAPTPSGARVFVERTLMQTISDRENLARAVLRAADQCAGNAASRARQSL